MEGRPMARDVTLLDLVMTVSEYTNSEAEVLVRVVDLVNFGAVRLCGIFKGARLDLAGSSCHAAVA